MITIDTQIWIYYFDPNSKENKNVNSWFLNNRENGIIQKQKIILNAIIPIEIAHNLFRVKNLPEEEIITNVTNLIRLKNVTLHEINREVIIQGLEILKKMARVGIGGRDSLILATMKINKITTIVTHDKNILRILDIQRIDPVFNPPLILKEGEEFNENGFKDRIKEL
jgi:predicted nucleic acid-binding protein